MYELGLEYPQMQKALFQAGGYLTEQAQADYKKSLREKALASPEDTETISEWAAVDPEGFKTWKEAQVTKATELTASQKDYFLAKKEGFEGTFMDFKQAISGVGPKEELEMEKLKVQIADLQERKQARSEKKQELKQIKEKKTKGLVSGIDNLVGEIDKAITRTETSETATGIPGAVTATIPGSPSYNLRRNITTIKANIGFDRLQAMRDASPTGGALGNVSEREIDALQSTIAALDPNMGDAELIEALNKVKNHYNNWRGTLLGKIPEEARQDAPQGAVDFLRQNPQFEEQFLEKYGYVPEGI